MDPELQRLNETRQQEEDKITEWYVLARPSGSDKPYRFAAETPSGCFLGLSGAPRNTFDRIKAHAVKEKLEQRGYDVQLAKRCGPYDVVNMDTIALEEMVKRAQGGNGEF